MLNFDQIKRIKITDVCGRYGIKLRYRGDWASAPCPLPIHKDGDKGRNFTINLKENYWRCFSESCNERNGGRKGGDCINFVALMENCREKEGAQKLADWYGLNQATLDQERVNHQKETAPENKKGEHMARPLKEDNQPQRAQLESTSPAVDGKGFIGSLDAWFNELFGLGPELVNDAFWKKCRNGVKTKVLESFRNGKLAARS